MSDLISRRELIEEIKSLSIVLNGKQIFSDDAKDTVLRIIKEQPTAYSVDKVVEELELHSFELGTDTLPVHYVRLNESIEIVKQGSVGTETETIRDKAVKWNNNSSKRVPYEFIDYVEGKRGINISDDVCKWKLEDEEANLYLTGCQQRQLIFEGSPKENGYRYCHYCGKKILCKE